MILRGGGCKFSDKLKAIASPTHDHHYRRLAELKLVVFVDHGDDGILGGALTKPLLDEPQPWAEGWDGEEEGERGRSVGVVMARGRELLEGMFGGGVGGEGRQNKRQRRRGVKGVGVRLRWEVWVGVRMISAEGDEARGGGERRKVSNARVVEG